MFGRRQKIFIQAKRNHGGNGMAEKGITEDIAEKVVDLISDAKEVSSLSSIARSLQNQTRQLSAEIGKLGKRILQGRIKGESRPMV